MITDQPLFYSINRELTTRSHIRFYLASPIRFDFHLFRSGSTFTLRHVITSNRHAWEQFLVHRHVLDRVEIGSNEDRNPVWQGVIARASKVPE